MIQEAVTQVEQTGTRLIDKNIFAALHKKFKILHFTITVSFVLLCELLLKVVNVIKLLYLIFPT